MKISELEACFNNTTLPNEEIRLDQATIITDPKLFVESHLNYLKGNSGNRTFLAYYYRLVRFYELVKK